MLELQPSQNCFLWLWVPDRRSLRSLVRDDSEFADSVFKQPIAFSRLASPEFCKFIVPFREKGRRESRALTAPAAWGATKNKPTS